MTSRGRFLQGLVACTALPLPALSQATSSPLTLTLALGSHVDPQRPMEHYNETWATFVKGRWWLVDSGYRKLCWALRDPYVDPSAGYVTVAPLLFYVLQQVQDHLATKGITSPTIITSGVRTPTTNRHTEHAARNSQHMHDCAIDGYNDGVSMEDLFAAFAITKGIGGLGLYDDHIHADTASVRTWEGYG